MGDLKDFYEVIIVGGGIVGIGLYRDLCLHQIPCLILDKGDFSSQTSQSSSKMLHGGIRYLEQCEFLLVKEALEEKNLWLQLAPNLCKELPFFLPVYSESKYPKWATHLGLKLYDLLSGHQNSPHKILNKSHALKEIPSLKEEGLKGAGVYYDAIMDDAKLALECLYDGLMESCGDARNYMEVTSFEHHGSYSELEVLDVIKGARKTLRAKEVIFATGPFTDKLLKKFPSFPWNDKLLLSKGSHLWIHKEALPLKYPVVLQTEDNRVIFVIPQRNAVLVGTTETPLEEEIFNISASDEDVNYLLQNLKIFFPKTPVSHEHILSTFSGVRPLIRSEGKSHGKTSREHQVYNPYHNVHVIMGGKYTTFRRMVQGIAQVIIERFNQTYSSKLTQRPLRKPSVISPFTFVTITTEHILEILREEMPKTFDDLVKRRLSFPSRKHWNQEIPFNDFFLNLLPYLKNSLGTTQEEILNFP